MYEETIAGLRKIVQDYKGRLTPWMRVTIAEAADAIEELSKLNAEITTRELKARMAKPRWIPVTERLPDAGKRVLCYCRANIYEVMKMWTDGDWVYDMNHVYMHSFVTHWMPLPKWPEDGNDA